MAGADLGSVFGKMCVQFQVAESNFLLLLDGGVSTASEMAHRLDKDSLEEILQSRIRIHYAYRDDGQEDIQIWPREEGGETPDEWAVFKIKDFQPLGYSICFLHFDTTGLLRASRRNRVYVLLALASICPQSKLDKAATHLEKMMSAPEDTSKER